MIYSEVSAEIGFENGNSTKFTVGPYESTDQRLNMVKANIMEYNDGDYSTLSGAVVNKEGSPIKASAPIIGASITTVERTTYI